MFFQANSISTVEKAVNLLHICTTLRLYPQAYSLVQGDNPLKLINYVWKDKIRLAKGLCLSSVENFYASHEE